MSKSCAGGVWVERCGEEEKGKKKRIIAGETEEANVRKRE